MLTATPYLPTVDARLAGKTVFCLYEDREAHEVGLRLTLASLGEWWEDALIVVFTPLDFCELKAWSAERADITWMKSPSRGSGGWNVKPHCVRSLLSAGAREVIWLDSDIIVTGDFKTWLKSQNDDSLVVAEDPGHLPERGTVNRAKAWGLAPGMEHGFTINTSVLRVTDRHRGMLERWIELLQNPAYQQAQAEAFIRRPFHLAGDQDALGALLGSARQVLLPMAVLRAGREIVHSGGVLMDPPGQRFRRALSPWRSPLFVHAIAAKPWVVLDPQTGDRSFDWRLLKLGQEVSSYVAHSRRLRDSIGLPCPWAQRSTMAGLVLRVMGLGCDGLRGLPLALGAAVLRKLGVDRRSHLGRK